MFFFLMTFLSSHVTKMIEYNDQFQIRRLRTNNGWVVDDLSSIYTEWLSTLLAVFSRSTLFVSHGAYAHSCSSSIGPSSSALPYSLKAICGVGLGTIYAFSRLPPHLPRQLQAFIESYNEDVVALLWICRSDVMNRMVKEFVVKTKDCLRLVPDSARLLTLAPGRIILGLLYAAIIMPLSLNRDMNRFFVIQLVFLSLHYHPRARSSGASLTTVSSAVS